MRLLIIHAAHTEWRGASRVPTVLPTFEMASPAPIA